jgi:hypothetical protein
MEVKLCDLCLKESGKLKVIGWGWKSWGWSNSGVRRIHYCGVHNVKFLKSQTLEEYRKMIYDIDSKYGNLIG